MDTVTATAAELNILDGVTATAAEINVLDGPTAGAATASKAVVLGASKQIDGILYTVTDDTAGKTVNITEAGTVPTNAGAGSG